MYTLEIVRFHVLMDLKISSMVEFAYAKIKLEQKFIVQKATIMIMDTINVTHVLNCPNIKIMVDSVKVVIPKQPQLKVVFAHVAKEIIWIWTESVVLITNIMKKENAKIVHPNSEPLHASDQTQQTPLVVMLITNSKMENAQVPDTS